MGYSTDFEGEFYIDRPVDEETYKLLSGLNETRRMKRAGLGKKYGEDGEFYCEDTADHGQTDNPSHGSIIDYNTPPGKQPGLWCQWQIQEDRQTIKWDGGEKFYDYVEWIKYLIDRILEPRGYKLNGEVDWYGEDRSDVGRIKIQNNKVLTSKGKITWEPET
jgi:hypothetical protein